MAVYISQKKREADKSEMAETPAIDKKTHRIGGFFEDFRPL